MRSPWKTAVEEKPEKPLYVVCATDPNPDQWIVFRTSVQDITADQVFATVHANKGIKRHSFKFVRVREAENADDAKGKAIGMRLEYIDPAIILKKYKSGDEPKDGPRNRGRTGPFDPVRAGYERAQAEHLLRMFGLR